MNGLGATLSYNTLPFARERGKSTEDIRHDSILFTLPKLNFFLIK